MSKRPRRKRTAKKRHASPRKKPGAVRRKQLVARRKSRLVRKRRRPARKKPRVVRRHTVKARFNVPQLTKAGSSLSLRVYAEEQKVGDITIGRGSLWWRGGHRQKMKRISWSDFAEMMDRLAYR